jgi:hypothetical protein
MKVVLIFAYSQLIQKWGDALIEPISHIDKVVRVSELWKNKMGPPIQQQAIAFQVMVFKIML